MLYKAFKDKQLSALSFGCMRLPVIDDDNGRIDEALTRQMVAYAMEHGINYYDTAWGYHMGTSEPLMGRLLSAYPRNSYYLATKFPGYDLDNMGKVEQIFEQQLERCRVDYFDFYLVHNVCELNINQYLDDERYSTLSYLIKQRDAGRIKHLGYSDHGFIDIMPRFLKAYGSQMEFCQIQLNWLDWDFQQARRKVDLLQSHNIPIWCMEPLRGGKLVNLAEKDAAQLTRQRPDLSLPAWCLYFANQVPGVVTTLSGMSDMDQLRQNVAIFDDIKAGGALSADDERVLLQVANGIASNVVTPCTACNYCVDHCPQRIDIPYMLELYTQWTMGGGEFLVPMALGAVEDGRRPTDCTACASCTQVCPQQIDVATLFRDFSAQLDRGH